jgi:hypothetical protein
MKGDANMKVPRETWTLAKEYAEKHGRKIRDVMADAIQVYVEAEPRQAPHDDPEIAKAIAEWASEPKPKSLFPEPLAAK